MMNEALLSSKNMCWCTPKSFFEKLNDEFHFVLDTAATDQTAKCEKYYTPDQDGLTQSWDCGGAVFCNPPYGRELPKWVRKAYDESRLISNPIVLLIPARTDTAYFHDYIYGKAEIRFLRGRLRFEDCDGNSSGSAPFPSMLVIYDKERKVTMPEWISVKDRLPDRTMPPHDVLVCHDLKCGMFIDRARYSHEKNKWRSAVGMNLKVTHWMPLPEPPEEGTR